MIKHLTAESFKKEIFDYTAQKEWNYQGKLPGIIDFYADWCGPCKMMTPILEELDSEYEGKLQIWKVNTEEQQDLSMVFGIQSIPSILFIPAKGQPKMSIGALTKATIDKMIKDEFDIE